MSQWDRIGSVVARHRITYGIICALGIASALTLVSMALYVSSGASRLDLSRPGYEQVRKNVREASEEDRFSSSGPINAETLRDFQARYTKHQETMKKLDNFSGNALDDGQLQIVPSSGQ